MWRSSPAEGRPVGGDWCCWDMRPRNEWTRSADVADAINTLLLRQGLGAPSQRAIAAETRLSPGTLTYEYGCRADMLRLTGIQVGRDHAREWGDRCDQAMRSGETGLHLLLPRDEQDLEHERLWGAWRELARGVPVMAPGIVLGHDGERSAVWRLLDAARRGESGASEGDIDAAQAALLGCIAAMTDAHEPWPALRAAAALGVRGAP